MAYCYRRTQVVSLSVCHDCEPCKNSWTDWDVVWVVDSRGPKEPCSIRWGRDPHAKGQFCGVKEWPIVGPSAMSCAKTAEPVKMPFGVWNRMGPKKHVLDGVTLAQSGEYDWTVYMRLWCGLFVKLLWPLVVYFNTFIKFATLMQPNFTKWNIKLWKIAVFVTVYFWSHLECISMYMYVCRHSSAIFICLAFIIIRWSV